MLTNLLRSGVEIDESLLSKIIIIRENGEKLDIQTYLKSLLIETLENVLGGDKDERNS